MRPDAGSIKIDGEETVGAAAAASATRVMRKFGMLFQGGALFDSLPVWENVAFGLIQGDGMAPRQGARRSRSRKLGAGRPRRRKSASSIPAELSGGMQKRVGLARAIAAEPEIIFFDEPTTGLDPIMADVINELIVQMRQRARRHRACRSPTTWPARARSPTASPCSMTARSSGRARSTEIDDSGNAYVEQFIHGRAEGPIQMQVRKL